MAGVFHEGEREIQRRAGVEDQADAVGRIIGRALSPGAERFLSAQRLAIATTVDARGRVWASLLAGDPGFLSAADPELLRIASAPLAGDPLAENLAAKGPLGLLVIDPRTRQRMRFNGRGVVTPDGVSLLVEQAYGNCPKYITPRQALPDAPKQPSAARVRRRLDPRQQAWLAGADTFFLASFHPEAGADASHRGGPPGFVESLGPKRISFPDYSGNAMFNTLGNLIAYPHAGLLLVDFENGGVLQLTGRASVGETRTVVLDVDEVRETRSASPLRFRPVTLDHRAASEAARR